MYTVIIIEDERNAARLLENMLNDIEPAIKVLEKCGDLPTGVKSIKKHNPQLVFLDIELPVYSGIQLLDFFNPEEITFNIIFTTASSEYAVRAFEMCAVDYLMKPIEEEKLSAALEKLTKKSASQRASNLPVLQQNFLNAANKKIVLPVANGYEVINLEEVYYLKAEGSYTQIFITGGKNMLVSKNLKHFQFVLNGSGNFIRIHRSIIVNIHYVKKLLHNDGGTLVLDDKTELPVANDKMEELLTMLQKM